MTAYTYQLQFDGDRRHELLCALISELACGTYTTYVAADELIIVDNATPPEHDPVSDTITTLSDPPPAGIESLPKLRDLFPPEQVRQARLILKEACAQAASRLRAYTPKQVEVEVTGKRARITSKSPTVVEMRPSYAPLERKR